MARVLSTPECGLTEGFATQPGTRWSLQMHPTHSKCACGIRSRRNRQMCNSGASTFFLMLSDSLSAKLEGASGTSKSANFSVQNAETLFTNSSTEADAALSGLAGPNPSGVGFDWGLPFFYGINLYTSIDGQGTPSGTPASPWWAY